MAPQCHNASQLHHTRAIGGIIEAVAVHGLHRNNMPHILHISQLFNLVKTTCFRNRLKRCSHWKYPYLPRFVVHLWAMIKVVKNGMTPGGRYNIGILIILWGRSHSSEWAGAWQGWSRSQPSSCTCIVQLACGWAGWGEMVESQKF